MAGQEKSAKGAHMSKLKDVPRRLLQFGAALLRHALSLWRFCLRRPLRFGAAILLLGGTVVLGNRMYWGTPEFYTTRSSPDGRYRLDFYSPKGTIYGWFAYLYPYFVKVYVHDGGEYRYRCTSPIKDGASRTPMGWPDDGYPYIYLGLDLRIHKDELEGFFLSPYPTKERICP
jgi:hypothetical protein